MGRITKAKESEVNLALMGLRLKKYIQLRGEMSRWIAHRGRSLISTIALLIIICYSVILNPILFRGVVTNNFTF